MNAPQKEPGSGCATFIYWGLPSFFVPLIMGIFNQALPFGIAISLLYILWNGRSWAQSCLPPKEANPARHSRRLWEKTVLFTLLQFVIIPLFLYTVIYGFCMITGTEGFH